MPTHHRLLLPQNIGPQRIVKSLQIKQDKSKALYDQTGKDLPPLEEGDKDRIRPGREKLWRKAEVLPRSYIVKDERGRVYRRNRQQIKKQIIATPQDQPMKAETMPRIVISPFQHKDTPKETQSTTVITYTSPCSTKSETPDMPATHTLATCSGRAIRKPQRLIETV